jgi:hypothetical protein
MRTTSAIITIIGSLLATAASAQVPQCTVPNTLVNGQVADATDVMENFNAVANCVESARGDTVTHEGTPATGEIAVFANPTGITGGNLTGDVTTSGSTATQLAASGVTPGTYSNPTISVDAKGRVVAAANGSAATSGGTWTLLYSNTSIPNPTPYVDVNVTGFSEVFVLGRGVTSAGLGYRTVQLSVDGGVLFFKSTGDYEAIADTGVSSGNYIALSHNGRTNLGRSFGGKI